MKENKTGTYILYAFGEILLVVIGILIALQVNNWNEDRINANNEVFYLEKIKNSLRSDSLELVSAIELGEEMLDMVDSALMMMAKPELYQESEFKGYLLALVWQNEFNPGQSVFDNLNSTGEIKIIRDQMLVDLLYAYYNSPTEIGMKEYARNVITPYMMSFDGISYIKFDRLVSSVPEGMQEFEGKSKPIKSYVDDPFFINAINIKRIQLLGQKRMYQRLQDLNSEMMDMIKSG